MKIVIAGGTGQVGTVLARHFHAEGHEVVVLSRGEKAAPWRVVRWDGETFGAWARELDRAEALINLAGRIVNCRYNFENRCEIWSSRSRSVRILGHALSTVEAPPKVWLQASTATIYAHRFDAPNDEYTGIMGGTEDVSPEKWRFSIDVARAWEGELALVDAPRTRKVLLRSAMTMSPDRGGIFDYFLWLVRVGLGGKAGSGDQYISWIHYLDFIRAVRFLIDREDITGPVNLSAPNPLPNAEFMAHLGQAWGKRLAIPIRDWMLEVGALFLGTESELILKSRRVIPARLLDAGFQFQFAEWQEASRDLCSRWKAS